MGTKELEKKSSGGGLVAAWKQNPWSAPAWC